jgi:hypothetical protein
MAYENTWLMKACNDGPQNYTYCRIWKEFYVGFIRGIAGWGLDQDIPYFICLIALPLGSYGIYCKDTHVLVQVQ